MGDMIHPLLVLGAFSVPSPDSIWELGDDDAKLITLASCWNNSEMSMEDQSILDCALQALRHVFSLFSLACRSDELLNVSFSSCIATFSWTTLVPQEFLNMVEERVPPALVVVCVYCILLKRTGDLWWVKGKAESLFEAIEEDLKDEMWVEWMEWPRKEICGV